jgi:Tfp pilus assembly protein PilO
MTRSFKAIGNFLGEPGPRRTIKLALAALTIFDLLFYLFAIGPLGETDRERRLQADHLRRQVRERSAQVEKLSALVKKVAAARLEGDRLLGAITMPRQTAFSTIVSELDADGRQAGVTLRDRAFNSEPIEGSETLSMLTVTQNLEGSYENLLRFLNLLDRSSRFLIIENLGAAPQQTGPKEAAGPLAVTLKLDAFIREGA